MRAFLAMTALAAAVSLPALAEDFTADTSLADNDGVVRSVNLEDLKAKIAETKADFGVAEGHTITETGSYGETSVRATTPDGLIFHLIGTACDTDYADGCLGFMVQVRYDDDDSVTTDKINEANLTYAAVSTWWDEEGATIGVTRYVILDGGQRMENLKINLENALALGPLVADVIWPPADDSGN